MENIDWLNVAPAGLAIAIFLGGMLMMFTGIWTARNK
jgi:succinate-acetate transporter protein